MWGCNWRLKIVQQLGVTIWGAYPGGAPCQPFERFAVLSKDFANGPPAHAFQMFAYKVLVASTGCVNSNEFQFLTNTGADQPLLADLFQMP